MPNEGLNFEGITIVTVESLRKNDYWNNATSTPLELGLQKDFLLFLVFDVLPLILKNPDVQLASQTPKNKVSWINHSIFYSNKHTEKLIIQIIYGNFSFSLLQELAIYFFSFTSSIMKDILFNNLWWTFHSSMGDSGEKNDLSHI